MICLFLKIAKEMVSWYHPYSTVCNVPLTGESTKIPSDGNIVWFEGGKLNACYNAVDRHVERGLGEKVAIIHEGNAIGSGSKITFFQLKDRVCRLANALKRLGVSKGEVVTIYMPMVPEAAISMLAVARIGAISNVVFAGFSSEALAARIQDGKSRVVITASEGHRGEKRIALKPIVDSALLMCPLVHNVVVLDTREDKKKEESPHGHLSNALSLKSSFLNQNGIINGISPSSHNSSSTDLPLRDVDYDTIVNAERPYCPCEWMDSEDPLFTLYTSGSTGKPKGVCHTTGGYLVYASCSHKYIFDVHENDVYACVADVGWITGHTYIVWAPLVNGSTTLMFESTPLYPDHLRYWDLIQRHKVTIFYTAPTAIRSLMKFGEQDIGKYDLSSLRILGTVGEPINPAAWEWYYRVVGKEKCAIVDTYWMTESGGIMMTPLPGVSCAKPGSCCHPFFGQQPVLLEATTGKVLEGNNVRGVLALERPWPSMARSIWGDHSRFCDTYLKPYPGKFFTGDGAFRDSDGYHWIIGRVDDVVNVSGHRLGTAELESALVSHPACAEAAVVGVPHDIKGQGIHAFCVLKDGFNSDDHYNSLPGELSGQIRKNIGGIAMPDRIYIVPGLPKTRSGKIMRRLLRKIASKETDQLGDISTLADPLVIEAIIKIASSPK